MQAFPPAVAFTRSQPTVEQQSHPPVAAQPEPSVVVAPQITQTVTLTQTPARTDLLVTEEQWGWMELRDYVVAEIIARFGSFPRNAKKEYGIFHRFVNEFGTDAPKIAQFAFGPLCDGWWGNAPISVNRFCKASDVYFGRQILERLQEVGLPTVISA